MSWGKDFVVAAGSDLVQNAPERAAKIGAAVVRNGTNMVTETGANIHDAAVLSYENVTGRDTGIQLRSSVAEQTGRALASGNPFAAEDLARDVAVNTTLNVVTAGVYGTAKEQYGALQDYAHGASIEHVENRLADAAGGGIVNLGVTAAFLGATGNLGAEVPTPKTVVEGVTQLGSKARAALEGGLDRLHDAIGTNDFTTLGRIEPPPVPTEAIQSYPTPFKQLSSRLRGELEARVEDRTATRQEWARLRWNERLAGRRTRGVENFWEQEAARLQQGQPGTRSWTPEQAEMIGRGERPPGVFGHHTYSVSKYPHLADDPRFIYPVTWPEHFFRWHGGRWGNPTHGQPLNPNVPEGF